MDVDGNGALAVAVFDDRDQALAARERWAASEPGEPGVHAVRLHAGEIDPNLAIELTYTRGQRRIDKSFFVLLLLSVGVGASLGAILEGLELVAPAAPALQVGVLAGVAASPFVWMLAHRATRTPAATIARELQLGRVVLTARCEPHAAQRAIQAARAAGGRVMLFA